jgi:hypothetical protein
VVHRLAGGTCEAAVDPRGRGLAGVLEPAPGTMAPAAGWVPAGDPQGATHE